MIHRRASAYRRALGLPLAALLVGLGMALPVGSLSTAAAATPKSPVSNTAPGYRIIDYPTAANTFPAGMTVGKDGKLWFTRDVSDALIGSFDPTTARFAYYTLNMGIYAFKAQGIATDPQGNLWMSANGTYAYRFDPANGQSQNYRKDVSGAEEGVTPGPDGDMWFTGSDFDPGCHIYKVNPVTSQFTPYSIGTSCYLSGITEGPDGNLWFLDLTDDAVGELNPATGASRLFPLPTPSSFPLGITSGPDGDLWFTEQNADKIGRINPTSHTITEYQVPTANAEPRWITAGPDGNIWFTEERNSAIGRIDPATGVTTEFSVARGDRNGTHTFLDAIVTGPDGNLWITDEGDQLLKFSIGLKVVTEPTSVTATLGEKAHFTSRAVGIPAPGEQWQESFNKGATWSPIPGATSSTLSVTATPTAAAAEYRALFTSSMGSTTSTAATLSLKPYSSGYWLAGRDGGVFSFGAARFFGSLPARGVRPRGAIVALASSPDGGGYWLVGSDGGVFSFGDAQFFGSLPAEGIVPQEPIVGIAPTPDGGGYWLVGADGGVFSFGDAEFFGSLPLRGIEPAAPVVGLTVSPSGLGYSLVGADGGVFNFGDAQFAGSLPSRDIEPGGPIVGSDSPPGSFGYWLAGSNGDVFAFGVPFLGGDPSTGTAPIVGIAPSPIGQAYWLANSKGGVFAHGSARFLGSLAGIELVVTPATAIVSIAAEP